MIIARNPIVYRIPSSGTIRIRAANISARAIFDRGPAIATTAVPKTGRWKLYSLIGTGLLHPNLRGLISKRKPIGSICFSGFRVRRPCILAVRSPSLYAA